MSERPHLLPEGLWVDRKTAGLLVDVLRRIFRDLERIDGAAPHPRLVELARAAEEVSRRRSASPAVPFGTAGTSGEGDSAIVPLMTTDEVAVRLDCTARNVRALAARGRLPARRRQHQWRFDPADVAAYLDERREESHAST